MEKGKVREKGRISADRKDSTRVDRKSSRQARFQEPRKEEKQQPQQQAEEQVEEVEHIEQPEQQEPDQADDGNSNLLQPHSSTASADLQEPFMGVKMRRRSSIYRLYKGDYLAVDSNSCILNILSKQGDKEVVFADNVIRVTRRRRLIRRILLITDVALYILDPKFYNLKRRITIPSIEKVCLSEQADNFFAIIVPSEYDVLFACTRKTEIVTVLEEASKKLSQHEEPVEVQFADKFEYFMDSEHVREVSTQQVEGGVKTSFVDRGSGEG